MIFCIGSLDPLIAAVLANSRSQSPPLDKGLCICQLELCIQGYLIMCITTNDVRFFVLYINKTSLVIYIVKTQILQWKDISSLKQRALIGTKRKWFKCIHLHCPNQEHFAHAIHSQKKTSRFEAHASTMSASTLFLSLCTTETQLSQRSQRKRKPSSLLLRL